MSSIKPLSTTDLESMFKELFDGPPETTNTTASRWFSPDYIQITDGHESNYVEFVEHIAKLRTITKSITISVHQLVQEGRSIADRHTALVNKVDGSVVEFEVLLIGERDEGGRFLKVWETTRVVSGGEENEDLGRAR